MPRSCGRGGRCEQRRRPRGCGRWRGAGRRRHAGRPAAAGTGTPRSAGSARQPPLPALPALPHCPWPCAAAAARSDPAPSSDTPPPPGMMHKHAVRHLTLRSASCVRVKQPYCLLVMASHRGPQALPDQGHNVRSNSWPCNPGHTPCHTNNAHILSMHAKFSISVPVSSCSCACCRRMQKRMLRGAHVISLNTHTSESPSTGASLSSHPCLSVLVPCLAGQAGPLGSSGLHM